MRWERVVEATQSKGDSETRPALSPTDEFADYERYGFLLVPSGPVAKPVEADYVRAALKRGLTIEAKTGVNPYKFGLIGSTDAHTGMSAIEEKKFAGKGQKDSRPELRKNSPGPRMAVRLFAGWNFSAHDLDAARFPASGYARGVPMGGDLTGKGKAPSFLVEALKDPDGSNLDRIQIVKGWIDADGTAHEKIFDVVWSPERKRRKDGKLPAVKNTVDLATGQYTNSVGAVQLKTLRRDPEYWAGQKAFYYARVLQIPTPRYSLYDAIKPSIDPRETGNPLTIQERAYTSTIWDG
jgi:Protein of unknown function (DUF3604)